MYVALSLLYLISTAINYQGKCVYKPHSGLLIQNPVGKKRNQVQQFYLFMLLLTHIKYLDVTLVLNPGLKNIVRPYTMGLCCYAKLCFL